MDIDNLGYGAGGGVVTAILTILGFKSRMDKQDKEIKEIRETVMYKDTCDATHKPIDTTLQRIEDKLDGLISRRRDDRQS